MAIATQSKYMHVHGWNFLFVTLNSVLLAVVFNLQ